MSEIAIPFGESTLDGLWAGSAAPRAVAVVACGAGSGMRHPFYAGVVDGLTEGAVSCLRFDFPYATAGRRVPDRPPVLLASWRAALRAAAARAGGLPLAATGKSMGGRIASMVAAEDGEAFPAAALEFFGYPLHPPGREDGLRDAHLPDVTVPMLFIQGTADPFARTPLITSVVERLGDRARLHAVEGGDHSFRVRGARRPDVEIGRDLGALAAAFLAEVVG